MMISDLLNNIGTIADIISSISVAVLGYLGISYIYSSKKKKFDETFNFLSKFKIRIIKIQQIFNDPECYDHILNALLIPKERPYDINTPEKIKNFLSSFHAYVSETLSFLENSDNQFPTYIGWTENLNNFIEFLEILNIYMPEPFYIFDKSSDKETFYTKNKKVIEILLSDINDYQIQTEKQISDKRNN